MAGRSGRVTQPRPGPCTTLAPLGYPLELLSEDAFLERLGLDQRADALRGHYSIADLSRILELAPTQLRRWVQDGLIVPAQSQHRLAYFDFQQVSFARRLAELLQQGVHLNTLRRQIERCRQWLPRAEDCLLQLGRWEQHATLRVRRGGHLFDASGQQYFDFDRSPEDAQARTVHRLPTPNAMDLFTRALDCEDRHQFAEAAACYRQAIALDPADPILRFNLGNVLYRQQELEGAAACFGEALARDPDYAEAWNNLGNALNELQRYEDAADALQQAVRLIPSYADAHFNLAEVLTRLDRPHDAQRHRQLYRQYRLENQSFCLRVFSGPEQEEG